MKKESIYKSVAALLLAAGVAPTPASAEIVKIMGPDNKVLGSYSASSVDYIEFAEGNVAEITANSIVIPLSDTVKFKMIKVEGGVNYTLATSGLTAETWTSGGATKQMEDFWIGEFEVTQGVWKEVMGVTSDSDLPKSTDSTPLEQSAYGDNYPIANVSWDDICTDGSAIGSKCFLTLLNERLEALKAVDPTLAAVLGDREFRLPSEWEWEYAAAGGKDYANLNYYYSGISGNTNEALDEVAVNGVTMTLTSVAEVGSKEHNALEVYDMSGNVWEWCSGLGYPGFATTAGFLKNDGDWDDSARPNRGGSWYNGTATYFCVWRRNYNIGNRFVYFGFRLAL